MPETPAAKADVTRLLKEWRQGDGEALDRLLPIVYDELRRIARVQLGHEKRNGTLRATELVHEAFVRLVDQRAGWENRAHFYGIAARCMRRILLDRARRRHAAKRPPGEAAVDVADVDIGESSGIVELVALNEALDCLAKTAPRQAQVAELKLFGGLENSEIGQVIGASEATVKRDWSDAKTVFALYLGPR